MITSWFSNTSNESPSETVLVIELTYDLVYSVKFKIHRPVFPSLSPVHLQSSLFNAENP